MTSSYDPGFLSLIFGSTSLLDETKLWPHLLSRFKPEPLLVEPLGALEHKTTKPINQPNPVLVTAKEQPQIVFWYMTAAPAVLLSTLPMLVLVRKICKENSQENTC